MQSRDIGILRRGSYSIPRRTNCTTAATIEMRSAPPRAQPKPSILRRSGQPIGEREQERVDDPSRDEGQQPRQPEGREGETPQTAASQVRKFAGRRKSPGDDDVRSEVLHVKPGSDGLPRTCRRRVTGSDHETIRLMTHCGVKPFAAAGSLSLSVREPSLPAQLRPPVVR